MKFKIGGMMLLLVLLSPSRLRIESSHPSSRRWVVWNVGQGQWVTYVDAHECWHFDTGGEFFPARKLARLCGAKKNYVHLSHWDWDHISFAGKLRRLAPDSCLVAKPLGVASKKKQSLLQDYTVCSNGPHEVQKIYAESSEKSSNGRSQVFSVFHQVLIPGDSSSLQERVWASRVPDQVKILILGHHGSRTSTSEFLLSSLPALKVAIASARFRKYGHPHIETLARLKKHAVPVLRTEDWGHLHIEMPAD